MKFFFIFLSTIVVCSCVNLKTHNSSTTDIIEIGFKETPVEARPGVYWCWLNGSMSYESITRDLEEMKDKGINRAEIWDVAAVSNPQMIPAGGPFMEKESVNLIKHAIAEGKRLNVKVGIIASSGWNAGGSWVTPDWASKSLYFSQMEVEGLQNIEIELSFPDLPESCPRNKDNTPVFHKEIAVIAFPYHQEEIENTDEIIDLTSNFKNGKLNWNVPNGKWTILRFVCSNNGQSLIVPSPNSAGLFIDFLDPKATERHLKYFLDQLDITPKNSKEKGLAYFEFDSMEMADGIPWTDSFAEIFKTRNGYDLVKYLPILAGLKIKDLTDRFNYDFKKTVSDQLIHSHYYTGTEFLKPYGAELVAEAGGPGPPIWNSCPVDALKALGNVSIPRGEFWIKHRNMFLIKEISSAAHIYGKSIVDAESFTTWRRWKDSPFEMKKYVDRAFCEGLNRITFHTFASTNPEDGLPGRTYHAGSDINPGTTWWEKANPFMDYLSKCSYMLQQGLFVADVCYYYGDQAPNFFPVFHDVPEKPMIPGLGKGYDYDVVNSDVILNRMAVKNGKIVLPDGMNYRMMLLPSQDHMPLEVLEKIKEMVEDGATIIGPRPKTVPGIKEHDNKNEKVKNLTDLLWGNIDGVKVFENKFGLGKIIDGLTLNEVLLQHNIKKDFAFNGLSEIDYIHRTSGSTDIYFLRNEKEESVKSLCSFRITEKHPEFWDPSTGKTYRIDRFTEEEGTISFDVELPAHGSIFVVFNVTKRTNIEPMDLNVMQSKLISGPWKINFPMGWGAPESTVFNDLVSWTEVKDQGVKYFSGTATYFNSFSLNQDEIKKGILLDLGEVKDVTEVFINGKSAGVLWKKPYSLNITNLVKAGDNELKIEVVNMWVNRLTGDMLVSPEERFCSTNQPYMTSESWAGGDETFRLQEAGLLGPVTIRILNKL